MQRSKLILKIHSRSLPKRFPWLFYSSTIDIITVSFVSPQDNLEFSRSASLVFKTFTIDLLQDILERHPARCVLAKKATET